MSERFNMNSELFERAIQIIESRSFLDKREHKLTMINCLCQIDNFKILMRDPQLEHYLTPYMEEFAQQVAYKHIPKGKILFYEGETISYLYFVMRGSLAEFRLKSQDDIQQEIYWDSQAHGFQDELQEAEKLQLLAQEKKKREQKIFQKLQRMGTRQQLKLEKAGLKQLELDENSHQTSVSYPDLQSKQQIETAGLGAGVISSSSVTSNTSPVISRFQSQMFHSRSPSNGKKNGNQKRTQLEEAFFTEEYKEKASKLKAKNDLCLDAVRFYSGQESEELLKFDNPHQERHFKKGKCLFKLAKVYSPGECLGEIRRSDERQTQKEGESIIVCSSNAFVLTISQMDFQKIFENLTERLNFVFNVLSNSFPTVKKLILYDFSFQFTENRFDLNSVLFHEGDAPTSVYIMKTGELDYRKNLNLRGEIIEKRIAMIIQGELFGHEDIFNTQHTHTVAACLNNTQTYSIRKEALLIYQFKNTLKKVLLTKADLLHKKLLELYSRNTQYIPLTVETQDNPLVIPSTVAAPLNNQSLLSSISNKQSLSPRKTSTPSSSQLRKTNKEGSLLNNNNNNNNPSLSHISGISDQSLGRYPKNYFSGIKNVNLGENDNDLSFKSILKQEPIQRRFLEEDSSSKIQLDKQNQEDEQQHLNRIQKFGIQQFATAGSGLKGKNKLLVSVIQTDRAQPQCVYSRTTSSEIEYKPFAEKIGQNPNDTTTNNNRSLSLKNRSPRIISDFKHNMLHKDLFALQQQINADFKSKQQQKILHSVNPKLKAAENTQQIDSNPSLNYYKEQTMEYFAKENMAFAAKKNDKIDNIFDVFQNSKTKSTSNISDQFKNHSGQPSASSFSDLLSPKVKAIIRPRTNSQISKEINSPTNHRNSSPVRFTFQNLQEEQQSKQSTAQNLQVQSYYVKIKDIQRRTSIIKNNLQESDCKDEEKQTPLNQNNNYFSHQQSPSRASNNNKNNSSSHRIVEQLKQERCASPLISSRSSSNSQLKKRPTFHQSNHQIDNQTMSFKLRDDNTFKKAVQTIDQVKNNNNDSGQIKSFIKINSLAIQDFITEKQLQTSYSNIINFNNIRSSSSLRLVPKATFNSIINNRK